MKKRTQYNQRRPSVKASKIKEILIKDLQRGGRLLFSDLFDRCSTEIRGVYATQGDEFLRLRTYELLQELVDQQKVEKDGRRYCAQADKEAK